MLNPIKQSEAAQAKAAYVIKATVEDLTQDLIQCLSQPAEAKQINQDKNFLPYRL